MSSPLIRLERVSKTYPSGSFSIDALSEIDLRIQSGEFVAFEGKSGSGKSTLLHVMGGLDFPSKGDVYFKDDELATLPAKQLAKLRGEAFGFIFQSFNLIPTMTALENVGLPLLLMRIARSERDERAATLLSRVGLSNRLKQNVLKLSGGEQQRVAIARALVTEPQVIFADEPTGNLDADSGAQVLELLTEIHADGKAVLLATHDPAASALAGRVLYIRNGAIVDS